MDAVDVEVAALLGESMMSLLYIMHNLTHHMKRQSLIIIPENPMNFITRQLGMLVLKTIRCLSQDMGLRVNCMRLQGVTELQCSSN